MVTTPASWMRFPDTLLTVPVTVPAPLSTRASGAATDRVRAKALKANSTKARAASLRGMSRSLVIWLDERKQNAGRADDNARPEQRDVTASVDPCADCGTEKHAQREHEMPQSHVAAAVALRR